VAAVLVMAFVIVGKSSNSITHKVGSLISATNRQQVLNVNDYLNKVETTSSLIFSDDEYCEYDATDDTQEDFDKIQHENAILSRIQDLGVMENFCDFGLVYANDHTIGWISNSLYGMYQNGGMYDDLALKIQDEKTASGWFFSQSEGINKICYVKRINENALLVAAFYNRELGTIFELPEELSDMVVRLVSEDNIILYSTEKSEVGAEIDTTLSDLYEDQGNAQIYSDNIILTVNKCDNKWLVVSSADTNDILKETRELKMYTAIVTMVMLVIVIVLGVALFNRLSEPVGGMMSELMKKADYDQLTGLMNKISFQETVTACIDRAEQGTIFTMIMLDMDNFKKVNDTLGHAEGDKVLMRIAKVLKRTYGDDALSGRLGGDEFALFMMNKQTSRTMAEKMVTAGIEILMEEFNRNFAEEYASCKLSLSAGIVQAKTGEMDFETMYKTADEALYESKHNGKGRYTWSNRRSKEGEN
jgi:diguanylate cyclase (GGDEF)-like protein